MAMSDFSGGGGGGGGTANGGVYRAASWTDDCRCGELFCLDGGTKACDDAASKLVTKAMSFRILILFLLGLAVVYLSLSV